MGRRRRIQPIHVLINEGYEQKLVVRSGGTSKKVTRREVVILQQVLGAIKGDKKAIRFVIETLDERAGVKHRKFFVDFELDGKRTRSYGNGIIRITYDDGREEWLKEQMGGAQQPIPAPTKAQIRRMEEEDEP